MSARRLEEFIGLIETAERVSGRRDSGSAYPKKVLKSSSSPSRGPPSQSGQDLGSSYGSVGVPRLALPSWSSSPTHPRLVGPPASHCGLSSISSFSTARDREDVSTERSTIPSTPMDTVRSSVMTRSPATIRRGSQDAAPDVPKNRPFVRKILEDQHPAVPDTFKQQDTNRRGSLSDKKKQDSSSPQASSGTSRQSSLSPEKRSPSKMPPKFPRKVSSTSKSPSRDSGKKASGSSTSREHSGSPSPVRKTPPKPSSPSHSYTTSFNTSSGSLSRSPSQSPVKSKLGSSKSSEKSIQEVLEPSPPPRTSRESMETRRKSWLAASSSRKTPNSQSSAEKSTSVTQARSRTASPKQDSDMRSRERKPMPMKADFKLKSTKGKVVIQEDKPANVKPSAAARRRPQSAPPRKVVKLPAKVPEEPDANLGDFSKSLKLLGVDIPSNRTEATKLNSQEVKVTTKEPTIRTRLLKRSGSYADLTQNIKKDMKLSEFEAVRGKVKEAVFEQWYFKKCAEEKEKKLKEEEEAEKLRKEKEEKQKEVEEQSKEEFQKWCKQKREKAEKEKRKQEVADKGKVQKVVDQEEVDRKNKEWMALKKKDQVKKKEEEEKKRLAEEKKKIEEDERRTQAEKTFLAWKEAKTKELKERYLAEKKKHKEKQEALEEKRKDADSAFIGWKKRKDNKEKNVSAKKEDTKNKEDGKDTPAEPKDTVDSKEEKVDKKEEENNNSRLEEAKKAYEAWLDLIEEREEENMLFEEERKRILMWKPPWYAGGKALF